MMYSPLDLSAGTNSGFNYWESANGRRRTWGGYGLGYSYSNRQNFEFLATYSKKIKDFQVNGNAGLDILKTNASSFAANTTGGLSIPDLFSLSNSKNTVSQGNSISRSARRSPFVSAIVGFRNSIFAEGTYRRDYISTERIGDFIGTYSVGLSVVFSDYINKNKSTFLSYGKLRASTGQVSNALGIYQNNILYTPGSQTFSANNTNNLLMAEPNSLVDPLLHGAANDEKEIGVEMRFFKSRVGLNATYWDRTNKDFPLDATVSAYTGYSAVTTNAGEVKKTGIDLQMFGNPIKRKNIDWTVSVIWGKLLKNNVISINDKLGIVSQTSATGGNGNVNMVSTVGQRWGQLRGTGIKRNADGVPLIRTDGLYEKQLNVLFGSSLPDYTGGVQNTFTVFKNIVVNFNIDFSKGGKFFSLSDYYGSSSGLYKNSAGLNDKGIPMRNAVADGGGVHVVGVSAADGRTPVDMYVDTRYYFENNGLLGQGIAEMAMRDLTFVKLREVSLGYKIPVEKLGLGKVFTNAVFSVVSRNPWLIYVKGKGIDPSELNDTTGESGQLPGTRSFGINLKLGF